MTGVTGPAFELDRFQREAIAAVDRDESVLVAAPTGSGKTVVAEHAVARAVAAGGKAFYTTPIKALSNQKFHDLVARHGREAVGLLTGDNAINGDAAIVVMTTEVLRNMIYGRSGALDGLRCVVLDEVHYLQDAYRGPVWEEVIDPPAPRGAPGVPVGHRLQRGRAGRVDRHGAGSDGHHRGDRASRRAGQPLPGGGQVGRAAAAPAHAGGRQAQP